MSREGLRTSEGHNKVCKLLEECEEVIEKIKDFKRKTLKPTKENSDDKGEKVKKRIRIPDHRFQKGKTISKIINLCLLFTAVERTKDKRKN